MANSFGTLATALIVQMALDLVYTERPILSELALDLSGEAVDYGQSVITRIHGIPAVQDFGSAAPDAADVDVSVTLNRFKQVRRTITLQEVSSTKRNLVEEAAMPMAVALANHMVDAIAANWTLANFTVNATPYKTTQAVAGVNYSTITDIRQALVNRGVQGQRFGAVNAAVYTKLLNDSTIVTALNNPNNNGAIGSGVLPGVAGFKGIFEYPEIPTANSMVGFFGSKDSVVMASRIPKDPRSVLQGVPFPGNLGVVTNPKTGLSVMVCETINADTLAIDLRLIWMYGTALGNANNGQLLVTA